MAARFLTRCFLVAVAASAVACSNCPRGMGVSMHGECGSGCGHLAIYATDDTHERPCYRPRGFVCIEPAGPTSEVRTCRALADGTVFLIEPDVDPQLQEQLGWRDCTMEERAFAIEANGTNCDEL